VQDVSFDANNWNNLERLILSQAIYEFGVDNMSRVATVMSEHAMLSRPKTFFTVKVSISRAWSLSAYLLKQ
jgi:bromodomain-containing protein 8